MTKPNASLAFALVALVCTSSACTGTRLLSHPTIVVHGPGGHELGASTDYGIVFLGRTARSGEIEVTCWFGDGPNIERTVVEPVGGGLYTADTEIRLPSVPIDFEDPQPGETLLLITRVGGDFWEEDVVVRRNSAVDGILLTVDDDFVFVTNQVGAGIYRVPNGDRLRMRLVGLVSGSLRLETEAGIQDYMTVVGPRDLWRLIARSRSPHEQKRWVYRDDIL